MPVVNHSSYNSPIWLRNGHLQTIWPVLFRNPPLPSLWRERLETPDGDFIDTVISRWQIKESMRTKLVNLFVDTEHVCYDDQGFTMVAEQVITALDEAVENGVILKQDGSGAYTVTIPRRADATEEQARNRIMPPIPWEATLRGGVHGVKVTGVLTVSLTGSAS